MAAGRRTPMREHRETDAVSEIAQHGRHREDHALNDHHFTKARLNAIRGDGWWRPVQGKLGSSRDVVDGV